MATGHFGNYEEYESKDVKARDLQAYGQKDRGFATSEVRSHKAGLTYEELRKFMWN